MPSPSSDRGVTRYTYRNRTVEVPDGYLIVGKIVAPHGLGGELRVELHTDFPERFEPGMTFFVGEEPAPMVLATARPHKGHLLIRFEDVYNRDAAEALRQAWIFVPEDEAVELEEDAYFVHDLVGLTVVTDGGETLGELRDVLFTGANEVYILEPAPGVNNGKEILLPAIAQVVRAIDLEAGVITVTLMDGLLET
ncbi:MAG: ribosome maturation factor RimM [Caldilineaceae bacterium]|nr:ribosome maturation factor RimM [Caldilineaceae bacterium]MCB9137378.1 ribosome maturation factor RimM [Caldilineaceae bacterium]